VGARSILVAVTPAREPGEYRKLREYIDDLATVLERDRRRATPGELEEARRLSDAAEEFYETKRRAFEAWECNPSGWHVPLRPEPPPFSWARIKLRLGLDDEPAEPLEEPSTQLRQLWQLTPTETAELRRDVTRHRRTGEPSLRGMVEKFGISYRQARKAVTEMPTN
jgi:hypothetical protein